MAKISNMSFHSFVEGMERVLKIRVVKAILAIFEVTERKATTGVCESESENPIHFPSFKTVFEILISHGS
jgi:hypothetical protein